MMRLSRFVLSSLSCATVATAQVPPSPPAISSLPAPIISHFSPSIEQALVTWTVQDVRCAGTPVTFSQAPLVTPAMGWPGPASMMKAVDYSFTIDESGRPLDVTRTSKDYVPWGTDLTPALVIAHFAPGAARRECSLRFVPMAQPTSKAPIPAVMAYLMFPEQRPTAAMYAYVRPPASTCFDPSPQVRVRAFPAFDTIPKQPGRQSWSMVGFDIDASGKPVRLKHEAGNGNAALDTASIAAVRDSRFAPGARTGCQYPYRTAAATVPPPTMPEEAAYRPANATCPIKAEWAVPPRLIYPPSFARRWIEGWAVVGYDVASWGATGNVRVLAAQPSAEFGDQALRMLSDAKRPPSATGYVGCVDRVSFRMPRPGEKRNSPDPAAETPPPAPF